MVMNRKICTILACVTAFFNFIYLIALSVYKVISSSSDMLAKIPDLFFFMGIFLPLAPLICWIVSAIMSCVNFEGEVSYKLANASITIGIVNDILVAFVSGVFMFHYIGYAGELLAISLAISIIHFICTVTGLFAHCVLSDSRFI